MLLGEFESSFKGQQHINMCGQIDSMIPIYDENFIVCGHEFEVMVSFQVTISILACSTYSCPKIDIYIYNVYCIYIYLQKKQPSNLGNSLQLLLLLYLQVATATMPWEKPE